MKRRYFLFTCLLVSVLLTGCTGEETAGSAAQSGAVSMPRTDVEGFLKALDASDIEGQYEAAQCFDVTPARVAASAFIWVLTELHAPASGTNEKVNREPGLRQQPRFFYEISGMKSPKRGMLCTDKAMKGA